MPEAYLKDLGLIRLLVSGCFLVAVAAIRPGYVIWESTQAKQGIDAPIYALVHWLQVKVRRTLSSAKIAGLQDRRQPEIGSKGQHQTS